MSCRAGNRRQTRARRPLVLAVVVAGFEAAATARALGFTMLERILFRADRIIE